MLSIWMAYFLPFNNSGNRNVNLLNVNLHINILICKYKIKRAKKQRR